jgi:hypothetical protein
MAGKSDTLENALLDEVLGATNYTAAGTVYIALYTAAPSDSGGGTEVAGNGYARVALTNNSTNWPNASGGAKANGVAITFPAASGGNWGTVTHFGIHSHITNDALLYWGAVSPNKAVNDGDTASFAIGDLDVTED